MAKPLDQLASFAFDDFGPPRYEQLASFLERAIRSGELLPGDRLPTVRQLSVSMGVSATTISSALDLLGSRRLVKAEVGRGTFVSAEWRETNAAPGAGSPARVAQAAISYPNRKPWRRSALMRASSRLRSTYANALECSTGRPDPQLLPLEVLKRAWEASMAKVETRDLQYAGPEPIGELARMLVRELEGDQIPVREEDLLIGTSAQQFFALIFEIVAARVDRTRLRVGVEEPGYPTLMDTMERYGGQLLGIAMDEYGAMPASLEAVLREGAQLIVLTPRGQNPTGASWSPQRVQELARVLEQFPEAVVVEDDQIAGIAETTPGTLLAVPEIEPRVVYVRSFSKSLAPDLRMAAAVVRPPLREAMAEAKAFADGWSSRLLQRVLSRMLEDDGLPEALGRARVAYRERRQKACDAINRAIRDRGGEARPGPDGVNLWVQLPAGVDAKELQERSAAGGVRIADGEPFFVSPGRSDAVRLNAGSVKTADAARAGQIVGQAVLHCGLMKAGPIHV